MSDQITLTAEDVAEYLSQHPDFFKDRLDLLDQLDMPVQDHGGGVADMQQYMLERLREEIDRLRGCTSELISVSRVNMLNTDRTHRAVLAMLDADSFAEFVTVMGDELPMVLDIDHAGLCFEQQAPSVVPRIDGRVREIAAGSVDTVLGEADDIWLVADGAGDKALFGPSYETVRSGAFIRLEPFDEGTGPAGLLVLGSHKPELFHPSQGKDLLAFLATVVEFTVRRWLVQT